MNKKIKNTDEKIWQKMLVVGIIIVMFLSSTPMTGLHAEAETKNTDAKSVDGTITLFSDDMEGTNYWEATGCWERGEISTPLGKNSAKEVSPLIGDTTPPTVTGHVPSVSATNVLVGANIEVTFSEPMNTASVEEAFSSTPSLGSGTFTWGPLEKTFTFNPSSDMAYSTTYTITIGTGAQDKAGNNMVSAYSWSFTTKGQNRPPSVVVQSPNGGETWSGTRTIQWTATDPDGDTIDTVDIYYSANRGITWNSIVTATANDGAYDWDMTTVDDGGSYLIKVVASDGTLAMPDVSDGVFSIVNPIANNTQITIYATIRNYGTTDFTDINVSCMIVDQLGNVVLENVCWLGAAELFCEHKTISLISGASTTLTWTWTPTYCSRYNIYITVHSNDDNPNDVILGSMIKVVDDPATQDEPVNNPSNIMPNHIIVGLNDGIDIHALDSTISDYGGTVLDTIDDLNTILIGVEGDIQLFMQKIKSRDEVKYAEPNSIFEVAQEVTDDPYYTYQENYLNEIHVPQAWVNGWGDPNNGIVVAILDNGVDYNHEDLKDHFGSVKGADATQLVGVGSDPKPDPAGTFNYHGTACAGIAAATINNAKGIAGVANVRILAVKVGDGEGHINMWAAHKGVNWVVNYAKDNPDTVKHVIISMSIAGRPWLIEEWWEAFIFPWLIAKGMARLTLLQACENAWKEGHLLVAGSGNEGKDKVYIPASYDCTIAVGGEDIWADARNSKSNYGEELELMAPWYAYTTKLDNTYDSFYATSAATAYVSGVAALIWSFDPTLTNEQVRNILRTTTTDLGPAGWDKETGYGLVNAESALVAVGGEEATYNVELSPETMSDSIEPDETKSYFFTLTNTGNMVDKYSITTTGVPAGWSVMVDPNPVWLYAWTSTSIRVRVTAPSDAPIDQQATITVTAKSYNDLTVLDSSTLTLIVKELTKDQSQEETGVLGAGHFGLPMSNVYSVAQSFVPTQSNLAKVKIKVSATGAPTGDLIISVRDSLDGNDLAYKRITPSSLGWYSDWVTFDILDVSLTPGQTYYIVGRSDSASSDSEQAGFYTWEVYISTSSDAYPNGETYANVGSGWVSIPLFNVDMTFQTWGY